MATVKRPNNRHDEKKTLEEGDVIVIDGSYYTPSQTGGDLYSDTEHSLVRMDNEKYRQQGIDYVGMTEKEISDKLPRGRRNVEIIKDPEIIIKET